MVNINKLVIISDINMIHYNINYRYKSNPQFILRYKYRVNRTRCWVWLIVYI